LRLIHLIFFTCCPVFLYAQSGISTGQGNRKGKPSKIEIRNADSFEGDVSSGKDMRKLIGHVVFQQDNVMMYCDSAYLYSADNSVDAFGKVRIEQGDSLSLKGDLLKYNGNLRIARLFDNISMTDGKMVLTTEILNYDMNRETADYPLKGKIVDGENILTSNKGYYFSKDKMLFFKDSVTLTNPKYVMHCDTMRYHTITRTAFFIGPTTTQSTGSDSTLIYCENGWYNTLTGKSYMNKNAWMQSRSQRLAGDSILYDRNTGVGEAFMHVSVIDTAQKIIVNGDYAKYDDQRKKSIVTGKTMLTQVFDKDSLFMHADTLFATFDTSGNTRNYFAFHHVKFFKTDLQGKCDSLTYAASDSTLRFYYDPIIWSGENQITADSINLQVGHSKIEKLNMYSSSFIASKEDSARYSQIRGKNMTGFFEDNKLHKIIVRGNGQTIYYAKDKDEKLMGVNRADCTDLIIYVKENKVDQIILIKKPDATFYPIEELSPGELLLKGFRWHQDLQPLSKEDIFNWR
jgi:lipopolysaccharide export system protein LptA